MYSQTNRDFSQRGEISQLTSTPFNQDSTDNEGSYSNNTQNQNEDLFQQTQDSNMQGPLLSPEANDELLSSKANAICEENRKIRSFVESSLKKFEKRRIQLQAQKSSLDEEEKALLDTHKCQAQETLDRQMSHEKWTEMYQNELGQRPKLIEKARHIQLMVDLFENHYTEGVTIGDGIERDIGYLHSTFEKSYSEEKRISNDRKELKSKFYTEMDELIQKARNLREEIMSQREERFCEIQLLSSQTIAKSNNISNLKEQTKYYECNKHDLRKEIEILTLQNKTLNENISKVRHQLDEQRTVSASNIENIKLQIVTEQLNNNNLEARKKEKDDCLNKLSTKQKELDNLSDQYKMAMEETMKRNENLCREIENCKKQSFDLLTQIKYQEEGKEKYKNVRNENTLFKDKISCLEKNIIQSENTLKDKKDLIQKLRNEIEDSKNKKSNLQKSLSELRAQLNKSMSVRNEIASKTKEAKQLYQDERENKMSRNKTIQNTNLDLVLLKENLSSDVEEVSKYIDVLKSSTMEIEAAITKHNENAKTSMEQLIVSKQEFEDQCEALNYSIHSKYKDLDKYEKLLEEAQPKQEELPALMARKHSLELEIQDRDKQCVKEKEILESSYHSKMLEMEKEREYYTLITQSFRTADEEATEKIKVEIRDTENNKIRQENELSLLQQKLNLLKNDEANKRNKVARIEKKLQTINKEVKVTKQDISDVANTTFQERPKIQRSTKLMTPSSYGSLRDLKEPPVNKLALSKDFPSPTFWNQANTSKWVKAVPDDDGDDYEFSEL